MVVLGITSVVLVAEVVGAAVTGSLALLADAGHMFTDVAGMVLAVLAVTFASRPATPERTFGYYRLEILAAVVNAVLLLGIALFILWQAWQRWTSPPEVLGGLMLAFAVVGLVANLIGLLVLSGGAKDSLNVRGAYLEVLGDVLGSVAVIVAITSGLPVLSVHVVVSDEALADGGGSSVQQALGECLADHFDVEHCTFQIEHSRHVEHEFPAHT